MKESDLKSGGKLKGANADNRTQPLSNPIANKNQVHIAPRKTANRLYGGYNHSHGFYGSQNTVDPLELFVDFCSSAKSKETINDVFLSLHNIAVNRLGFSFTALGLVNNQSKYINIRLIDRIGNVFSSRILFSDNQNPLIKAFEEQSVKKMENINFLNMSYLNNSPCVITPLVTQGECVGVFITGYNSMNNQNNDILSVLTDYLTLFVINKDLLERVNKNLNMDSLTGLQNHRGFQETLSNKLIEAERENHPLSVIIFDINNIAQINREYGHAKGDEIIKLVANKIKENIRAVDIAGRYGGDEIAIILPDFDNSEASYIAEYMNYTISCCLVDDVGPVKVSIGLATYPTCTKEQEKLLIMAEQAMFLSKSKGYKNGMSMLVNAQNIDFWSTTSLDSFAAVVAKRHSQWGINFEEELVNRFHADSINSNSHMVEVVTSLAGAIDAKDTYTKGHSTSVSRYAEALARALNLPENEVERIKLGALLHDVGKIGIPESVLGKQGKLTDEEWEIMKQHPSIGVTKVLKPIESLADLIPLVEHHHEHWDGSGYPHGLKGEQIPLGARIISIADCFHALISDRPYRKGLGMDKAIEIMRVGAGIQWDKALVRKFLILAPSLCTKV